jgi:hypothetical protein
LSSSVPSSSPVVAAVGLAVARSQRLAALAVHCTRCLGKTQRRQPNEVSLSSAGGEERRTTTNNKPLERPPQNQRQQNHERPPEPLRSGAFTMQQSRQPPLNPAAGTPAATIGMRPATPLRTKAKSVNGLLRAVGSPGSSYASSAATRPYRPEEALSIKKCERASSGR